MDHRVRRGADAESPRETYRQAIQPADGETAATFARLAVELHEAESVEETVEAVVQFALQALNCTYAGVALHTRGSRPEIAAVTDQVVADVYNLQIDSQAGPLVESLRDRTIVLIRDTTSDNRWPDWAVKVAGLGVRSVLDVPLAVGANGQSVGVLGLYSPDPDAFGADDEAIAHILARHASVALATARREQTMTRAVDARKLVGQAMGILMERYDLDGDRAFAILRRYSQDTNTKLRDVAQQLIDTRKLPGTAGPRTERRTRP
ncbi:ANTAR domain-containing protein [Kribbella pittospori]|uniref:ANTAR domain-containing protein n=1 Tax=Kribbella pittospori TaxID=722689 RepID=A0A4V2M6Y7_9ACTN|nr:GAF and ANTAR domain-containing protein [Kribbella pittospori]TCC45542.1 ANTAR domain-containing protein [Kribbella pittospori]